MKYKTINLASHQRTGSHYIAAIISTNFLNNRDYKKIHRGHKLPHIIKHKNTAYIYTWREFEEVAKSIYTMRQSFGLNNVDSFESFLKNRYCDMWKPIKHPGINVIDLKGNKRQDPYISPGFRNNKYTPFEWWKFYHDSWAISEKENKNVIKVSYNDLMTNFNKTMRVLAKKLGSPKKEFSNIEKQVGWYVKKRKPIT